MADVQTLLDGACALRPAAPQDHVSGVPAGVVASPTTPGEVSALLRICHQEHLSVIPRGHGTKLAWGAAPTRADVLLETGGLTGVLGHSRGDLIATAAAGTPLAQVQDEVAQGGHQLVVDDLLAGAEGPGSTLGGAVATNLAGARRLWTGALRDLVIGVRMVRADGTIAKAGGKVVKNVAGYDLAKLLTGSFGSLAVITEVTFRLHPVPRASAWVSAEVPAGRLGEVVARLNHSQLVLHALEVHAVPEGGRASICALVTGTEAGVRARAAALADQLTAPHGPSGGPLVAQAMVASEPPPWWSTLPGGKGGRRILLKTTARLSGVAELVSVATRAGLTVTGSAGAGVVYASVAAGDQDAADLAPAVLAVREASTRLGGSTVVLEAPAEIRARVDTWGPVPGMPLMTRIKDEFDPRRVLSPGRFVGGL